MNAFSFIPINEIPWVCSSSRFLDHEIFIKLSNFKLYRFSIEVWNAFCRIDQSRYAVSLGKMISFSSTAHRRLTKAPARA